MSCRKLPMVLHVPASNAAPACSFRKSRHKLHRMYKCAIVYRAISYIQNAASGGLAHLR
jgi:hypothetical protein